MASRAEKQQKELINRVATLVRKGLSPTQAKLAEAFVRRLYSNVPPDDILGESTENVAGAAAALLGFARQRRAGKAKVHVYNPQGGGDGWSSSHTVIEIVNDDMPFLVDSVTAELGRYQGEVHLVIHPIMDMVRDRKGNLKAVHAAGEGPAGTGASVTARSTFFTQPPQ